MHLRIEFENNGAAEFPIHYNHILQGFIYRTIDERMAAFLHDMGYGNTRKFKLFTFSRLMGSYDIESTGVLFSTIYPLNWLLLS